MNTPVHPECPKSSHVSAHHEHDPGGSAGWLVITQTASQWGPRPGRVSGWVLLSKKETVTRVPMTVAEVKQVSIYLAQQTGMLVEGGRYTWDEAAMPDDAN